MNAVPQISPAARAASMMVTDLACRFDNHEACRAAGAIAAAEGGRASFWTRAQYSNAVACLFVNSVNAHGLTIALRIWADAKHPRKTPDALLRSLIPLNVMATIALQDALETAYWDGALGAPGRRDVA